MKFITLFLAQILLLNTIVFEAKSQFVTDPMSITATDSYSGIKGNGYITIRYATGTNVIYRPLIVVEGFDPGHITSPENKTGVSNIYNSFLNGVVRNGGSDDLRNLLVDFAQYDVVYVDWSNGTDYLQRNAL